MTITTLHSLLLQLPKGKRYGVAMLLGALAALAMAPFYLVFVLIPAFCGLLWLISGATGPRAAFTVAWWFGVGYFSAGLYWIAGALLVDAARYGWMVPFAIAGLSAGLAIFPGLVGLATNRLTASFGGIARVLVFAALWTGIEMLRGWVLTGFPWNLIGSTWALSDAMMQGASITGIYGLSLFTVIVATSPATLVRERDWGGHIGPTVLAGVLLAGVWSAGLARLGAAPALGQNTVPDVILRLVQPNIAQQDKWKPALRVGNLKDQIAMSAAPTQGPSPTHVIWSETAATYYLSADYPVRRAIAQAAPKGGLILTGAPRITTAGEKPLKIWNSLYALDDRGDIVGTYDKTHLVPFGEYMPLRNVTGLDKIVGKGTDFSPGPGVRTLRLPGLPPVSPLICYEVIFPGNVVDPEDRPEWMLNITNDAWYGISTGPYQHFDAARFRAVEQGLPLVRVANTGISGVIDSYGRVVKQLNLGEKGSLDSALPKALSATVFSRYGNVLALLLMVATGVFGMVMGRRRGS